MKHPDYDRRYGPRTAAQVAEVRQAPLDGLWYVGIGGKGYPTRAQAEAARQRYIKRRRLT